MSVEHIDEYRLQEIAFGEPLQEGEKAHIDTCSTCREELAAYQAIFQAIPAASAPELSPEFSDNIMDRIPDTLPQEEKSRGWLWIPGAAAILLAFIGLLFYLKSGGYGPGELDAPELNSGQWAEGFSEVFGGSPIIWIAVAIAIVIFAGVESFVRKTRGKSFLF